MGRLALCLALFVSLPACATIPAPPPAVTVAPYPAPSPGTRMSSEHAARNLARAGWGLSAGDVCNFICPVWGSEGCLTADLVVSRITQSITRNSTPSRRSKGRETIYGVCAVCAANSIHARTAIYPLIFASRLSNGRHVCAGSRFTQAMAKIMPFSCRRFTWVVVRAPLPFRFSIHAFLNRFRNFRCLGRGARLGPWRSLSFMIR